MTDVLAMEARKKMVSVNRTWVREVNSVSEMGSEAGPIRWSRCTLGQTTARKLIVFWHMYAGVPLLCLCVVIARRINTLARG